jgi:hypothetical protein
VDEGVVGVRAPAEAKFSIFHVQTGSWAHPIAYLMCAEGSFREEIQSDRSVKLTTHLHLVFRSRMVVLHLHSPILLRGMTLNSLNTGTNLPLHLSSPDVYI